MLHLTSSSLRSEKDRYRSFILSIGKLFISNLYESVIFLRAMILIAYRHAFQFGMNNERKFVLNIRIVALEHGGEGGILEVYFSWYVPQAIYRPTPL